MTSYKLTEDEQTQVLRVFRVLDEAAHIIGPLLYERPAFRLEINDLICREVCSEYSAQLRTLRLTGYDTLHRDRPTADEVEAARLREIDYADDESAIDRINSAAKYLADPKEHDLYEALKLLANSGDFPTSDSFEE